VTGFLGGAHLLMLYLSPKLRPSDPAVAEQLTRATVPLTDTTNMWRLWFGFNASHALGALCFASTYAYLALVEPAALFATPALCAVGLAYLLAMLVASLRYWFLVPTVGISLAALAFATGAVLGATG
jgi:hypothetical protein